MEYPVASLALLLVVPASIVLFSTLRPTRAVLALMIGGVLLLPEKVGFDAPLIPPLDKASIPTICMLIGMMMKARQQVRDAKVGRGLDLALFVMMLGSAGTVFTNGDTLTYGPTVLPGMTQSDLVSDWISVPLHIGAPFLLGRVLFRSAQDARDLLLALAIAGLLYAPFVLIELRFSPQFNKWIYGFSQHSWEQTKRGGGWRPMVFTHHGLALALFVSASAFAAWALTKRRVPILGLPPGLVASALSILLALLNSMGALVYGVVGVPIAWLFSAKKQLKFAAFLAFVVALYPILRITGVFPVNEIVDLNAKNVNQDRAGSLFFRFYNEDMFIVKLFERPLFGWGGWARGHVWNAQGWNMSVLDGAWLGMLQFGFVRLVAQSALLLIPIFVAFKRVGRVAPADQPLLAGVGLVCVFYTVDLLPNGMFNELPMFFSGALAGLAQGMTNSQAASQEPRSVLLQLQARLAALQARDARVARGAAARGAQR
jgi:hypothetical protein